MPAPSTRSFVLAAILAAVAMTDRIPAQVISPAASVSFEDVLWRIRREATDRSALMPMAARLTDRYGPRLTGSRNLRQAQDWILTQLSGWGLEGARLEAWDFGHDGWHNERAAVHLVSPVHEPLVAEVLAWTPSSPGVVTAPAVVIEPPLRPTATQLDAFLSAWRGRLGGKAVLVGRPWRADVAFDGPAKRRDDADMRVRFSLDGPIASAPAIAAAPRAGEAAAERPLTADRFAEQLDRFLVSERAALRVNDGGRAHGQIRAFNNRTFDLTTAVPTIVLRNEDYGRIARLMAGGDAVMLDFDIVNRTFPEGRTQHNVVAELPGSDRSREVVMFGAHLDSWHAGTGATDNAIGAAVMLEVMRVLRTLGVQPRRTLRLALWSGEEQGLRGSTAYVASHFGTAESPKREFDDLVAYLNLDRGTGRPRGMTLFGPPAAARQLRHALQPLSSIGFMGVTTTRSRNRAGSDHSSFNAAGLPGISVSQDPIEYDSHTWHTNLDTYERLVENDAQQAVIAIAAAVYHLATSDERLPRFTKGEMPALRSAP